MGKTVEEPNNIETIEFHMVRKYEKRNSQPLKVAFRSSQVMGKTETLARKSNEHKKYKQVKILIVSG